MSFTKISLQIFFLQIYVWTRFNYNISTCSFLFWNSIFMIDAHSLNQYSKRWNWVYIVFRITLFVHIFASCLKWLTGILVYCVHKIVNSLWETGIFTVMWIFHINGRIVQLKCKINGNKSNWNLMHNQNGKNIENKMLDYRQTNESESKEIQHYYCEEKKIQNLFGFVHFPNR